jgi:hypothetical protein
LLRQLRPRRRRRAHTPASIRAITTAQPFCDRYGIVPIIDERLAKFDQRHAQRLAA